MFKNRYALIGLALAVLAVLSIGTIAFTQRNDVPTGATNAAAEQDKRMVMQESERERLDQLNANSSALPASATNTSAEQDLRMVMQEQERERLDQLNASSSAEAMRVRNAAEQDLRMMMQELERERLDQLNTMAIGGARPIEDPYVPSVNPSLSNER